MIYSSLYYVSRCTVITVNSNMHCMAFRRFSALEPLDLCRKVTDQNLEPQSRAARAWLCEPKVNRAARMKHSWAKRGPRQWTWCTSGTVVQWQLASWCHTKSGKCSLAARCCETRGFRVAARKVMSLASP